MGNDATYENIDTHSNGFSWGLQKGKQKFEVEWSHRMPFIHRHISNEINKEFYLPSTKFSFKYSRILQNSIKHNSVTEGTFCQMRTEIGLPVVGNSKFVKFEFNHRKYYDAFFIRQYFNNSWMR